MSHEYHGDPGADAQAHEDGRHDADPLPLLDPDPDPRPLTTAMLEAAAKLLPPAPAVVAFRVSPPDMGVLRRKAAGRPSGLGVPFYGIRLHVDNGLAPGECRSMNKAAEAYWLEHGVDDPDALVVDVPPPVVGP